MPVLKPVRGIRLNKSHPLARGLVGLWLMNEGSGNKVFDLSRTSDPYASKDLPFISAPYWNAGKFGSCIQFDGVDDCIGRNVSNFMSLPDKRSISIWIETSTTNAGIFGRYSHSGGYQYQIWIDVNGKAVFKIAESNTTTNARVMSSTIVNDEKWHHICGTYDKAHLKIYIDGIEEDSTTATFSTPTAFYGLFIGVNSLDGVNIHVGFFAGKIDIPLLWNRALSASEAAQLYREPFCMFEHKISPALFYISIGGEDFFRTIDDGLGITDMMGRIQTQVRTINDGVGSVDIIGRIQIQTRVFADALGITDAITSTQAFARTIADDLGLADDVSKIMTNVRVFAESLGLTDAIWKDDGRTVVDNIGIADSVARTQVQARIVAEAMGITDDVTRVQIQLCIIADAIGLTDAMTPGQIITFAEAMGMTDAMTHTKTQIRIITDDLGITDDVTRIANYVFTQTDDVEIADAMIRVAVALRTVSDNVGMTDVMSIAELIKAAWAFMIIRQTHN